MPRLITISTATSKWHIFYQKGRDKEIKLQSTVDTSNETSLMLSFQFEYKIAMFFFSFASSVDKIKKKKTICTANIICFIRDRCSMHPFIIMGRIII